MSQLSFDPPGRSLVADRIRRGAGPAVAQLAQEFALLRETLGLRPVAAPATLAELLAEADALLRGGARRIREVQAGAAGDVASQVAALTDALSRVDDLRDGLREYSLVPQLCVPPAVHEGLARLAEITSSTELIEAAAREVSRACGLERAALVRVEHTRWTVEACHPAEPAHQRREGWWADRRLGVSAGEQAVLATGEATVVRRDAPDRRGETAAAYALAPIGLGRLVAGVVYGDHGPSGPPVDEVDRDRLSAFAGGFAGMLERVLLREQVSAQQDAVRRELLGAVDDVLASAYHAGPEALDACGQPAPGLADHEDDLLTARQRQVLGLIARGATNAGIADELDISEDTVKTHVKNIMAKLAAHSRAEALSRYHVLTAERRRGVT